MIPITLSLSIVIFGGLLARSSSQEVQPGFQNIRDCMREHNLRPSLIFYEINTCLQNFIGDESLQNFTVQTLQNLMKKICREDPIKCITQAKDQIDICLDETLREAFNIFVKMMESGRNFICKDDGQKLIELLENPNTPICLEKVGRHIESCRTFDKNLLTNHLQSGQLYNEDECRKADESSKCLVDKVKHSCDTGTGEYIGSLIHSMLMSTPCSEYLPNSAVKLSHLPFLVSTVFAIAFYWHVQY